MRLNCSLLKEKSKRRSLSNSGMWGNVGDHVPHYLHLFNVEEKGTIKANSILSDIHDAWLTFPPHLQTTCIMITCTMHTQTDIHIHIHPPPHFHSICITVQGKTSQSLATWERLARRHQMHFLPHVNVAGISIRWG